MSLRQKFFTKKIQALKNSLVILFISLLSLAPISVALAASDLSYREEIESVVPCYGGNCQVAEIAVLPQSNFRDEFLPLIARFLIYAMGFVSFVVFFVAGAILIFSWGEEDMTKKAKNAIIWGVTGVAFAAGSYILVKSISEIDYMEKATSVMPSSSSTLNQDSPAASPSNPVSPSLPASPATATTSLPGGQPCGSGKGVCKNYGTGWTGCSAGYETYTPGNLDCRSERCCAPSS